MLGAGCTQPLTPWPAYPEPCTIVPPAMDGQSWPTLSVALVSPLAPWGLSPCPGASPSPAATGLLVLGCCYPIEKVLLNVWLLGGDAGSR